MIPVLVWYSTAVDWSFIAFAEVLREEFEMQKVRYVFVGAIWH